MPLHPWLDFDLADTGERIPRKMREIVSSTLLRRGCVVAVSGGIDSSVCAALATLAMGKEKMFALVLPERDSSPRSKELGVQLCKHLGIPYEIKDIASTLEAIGCYQLRDDAIRSVFPDYGEGWKNKIVISQNLLESDRINFFKMVVENPQGERMEKRLPVAAYLQIVAATNFKQRIRKTLEFFHADRLNFAVVGTPNRLEYDQGFFVKNGDGAADIKPIAHLYKSQVYELANHLGLPRTICDAQPTTDTYSLSQGQDEFYFVLPYDRMDIVLCGMNMGKTAGEVAREAGLTAEQVERVFRDIRTKRSTTRPLHLGPVLVEAVPEIRK
ncbi:MAG: NAD(+) synthase [Deltaproteobacteria bacterium]|nr:MAG: NAD(+) synthase [Deltaproteobacteria bacterium]